MTSFVDNIDLSTLDKPTILPYDALACLIEPQENNSRLRIGNYDMLDLQPFEDVVYIKATTIVLYKDRLVIYSVLIDDEIPFESFVSVIIKESNTSFCHYEWNHDTQTRTLSQGIKVV